MRAYQTVDDGNLTPYQASTYRISLGRRHIWDGARFPAFVVVYRAHPTCLDDCLGGYQSQGSSLGHRKIVFISGLFLNSKNPSIPQTPQVAFLDLNPLPPSRLKLAQTSQGLNRQARQNEPTGHPELQLWAQRHGSATVQMPDNQRLGLGSEWTRSACHGFQKLGVTFCCLGSL